MHPMNTYNVKELNMGSGYIVYLLLSILLIEVLNYVLAKRVVVNSDGKSYSLHRSILRVIRKTVITVAAIGLSYYLIFEVL